MSTPLIIVLAIAFAAVMVAVPALFYYALWKVWQATPQKERRRQIIVQVVGFTVSAPFLAVLIVAPWGTRETFLYVVGGICVCAVLLVFVVAIQGFIRSRRGAS